MKNGFGKLPFQIRPRGATARAAGAVLRNLDRFATKLKPGGESELPFSKIISERHLWQYFPRSSFAPSGSKPLLALTFDLDYQADTDALNGLIELVGHVGARMSVVSIGKLVEADPGPYQAAVEAGHEIVNHTWSHPDNPVLNPDREFWHLSADEMTEEIGRAQEVFQKFLGVRPIGFRSPHFKDAHRLIEVLEHFPEMRYFSSSLASKTPLAVPYFPTKKKLAGKSSMYFSSRFKQDNSSLLQIPLTPCPQHRWSPFCSYHAIRRPVNPARGAGMHSIAAFCETWKQMLRGQIKEGFASVYFDPMDVMRDRETTDAFRAMLTWADAEGWTLTTLGEVERVWRTYLTDGEAGEKRASEKL